MPVLVNSFRFPDISGTVNPSVTSATFTAPTGGDQAKVNLNYVYAGADTLEIYAVTGTDPVTVSKPELLTGTGGTNTLEFVDGTLGASPGTLSLSSGLTATSETADRIVFYMREANNGGESDITTVVASNLDYTAPTFDGAGSTPADGATASDNTSDLVAAFNENVIAGSGNFYLRNITDAQTESTVAVGSCTFSGSEVTIPFADREADDSYAVRWDAGVVTNAAGIDVAANTGDTTWNFTAAAAPSGFSDDFNRSDETLESDAAYTNGETAGALSVLSNQLRVTDPTVTATGRYDLADAAAIASADGSWEIDVTFDTGTVYGGFFLQFRFTDTQNWQQVFIDSDGGWGFEKDVSSTVTSLASGTVGGGDLSDSTTRRLVVTFSGSTVSATFDGSALFTSVGTGGEATDTETGKRIVVATSGVAADVPRGDDMNIT